MLAGASSVPVSAVVTSFGYRSEAAFRRWFAVPMGVTCSGYRQVQRAVGKGKAGPAGNRSGPVSARMNLLAQAALARATASAPAA